MATERRHLGDTFVTVSYPWGGYSLPGRVRCTDGTVRALKRVSATADTFFSVPGAVSVNGRTVAGFVSQDGDEWTFTAYSYGTNGHLLPGTHGGQVTQ